MKKLETIASKVYEEINEKSVTVYFNADLNDITPFKAVLNDMYEKDISKKIRSIKKNRAEAGLYMGTYAPYGYKKDPENKNHLVIDPEVAPIVRKIFAYGAEGIAPINGPKKGITLVMPTITLISSA